MLDILTQSHAPGMREDRDTKFRCHQQDGKHLVNTSQTAAINLAKTDRTSLQQLLEHHPAMTVFTGCHTNGRYRPRNGCVAKHIIRGCWLFNPKRPEY